MSGNGSPGSASAQEAPEADERRDTPTLEPAGLGGSFSPREPGGFPPGEDSIIFVSDSIDMFVSFVVGLASA